jgi:hypothetical protein
MVHVNLCKNPTIFRMHFLGRAGLPHSKKNNKEEIKEKRKKERKKDEKRGVEEVINPSVSYFNELCWNFPGDTEVNQGNLRISCLLAEIRPQDHPYEDRYTARFRAYH